MKVSRSVMRSMLKQTVARLRLYRLAYGLYELYRLMVKPSTRGALVALWWEERLLLVQCSYRSMLSFPGGGIEAGETPREAALRELKEELGIMVSSEELLDPLEISEDSRGGRNTVSIFTLHAAQEPSVHIDGLEVIGSQWLSREEAMAHQVTGHVRVYLLNEGWQLSCSTSQHSQRIEP